MGVPQAPSIAYGAAAGTAPPALVAGTGVPAGSNPTDDEATFQFGSGTTPTTGTLVTVTLGGNYSSGIDGNNALRPDIIANNQVTDALGLFIASYTSRQIVVGCKVAPSASQANTVYQFTLRT